MPRKFAKRANKPNPREDRNEVFDANKELPVRYRKNKYKDENGNDIHRTDDNFEHKSKKIQIIPRNLSQEKYLEMLENEDKHIIFAMGAAGTGKTVIATQYAIKMLQEGKIKKIILTRPAVSVDEQHGFLPGTLIEKMAPWVVPIMDVFKEYYSVYQVEKMLQNEVIEICPLAYMRGRNLKYAIILADEMQNATPSQMKMVLTRIAEGSRMIITGDLKQHDRGFEANGLKDFVERFERKGSPYMGVCRFGAGDIERHPVIEHVLDIYGDVD
jgi:phosphate starvation-inducible PhoH-like protein